MAFKKITGNNPRNPLDINHKTDESVGVSIVAPARKKQPLNLCLRLTEKICRNAKLRIGDRVSLFYDEDDNMGLIKRTPSGPMLCASGGYRGASKKRVGTYRTAHFIIPLQPGLLPVKYEKTAIRECENINLDEEGILFTLPAAIMEQTEDGNQEQQP